MKIKLAAIEARLQALIEGSAARLFPLTPQNDNLATLLVQAMNNAIDTRASAPLAPNLYTLFAHPNHVESLRENDNLLDTLVQVLEESGNEAGLRFLSHPVIRVSADPNLAPGQIRVKARNSWENLPETADLPAERAAIIENVPSNAFLIVNGTDIFPLTQKVINIGRRDDNQLVVSDARVSRIHSQLRVFKGRYMIFDLDSTGGTFVNGERVHQHTLYPGDVISLAGVPLVYGQDSTYLSETQTYDPNNSDGNPLGRGHDFGEEQIGPSL
jgi:FHA domain/FhaA, N-terminal domain